MTHFARGRILIGNQKFPFYRANRNHLYRLEVSCSHLPCISPIGFRRFCPFSLRFPLPSGREKRFQIASRYEPSLSLWLIFQRAIANQFAHMSDRDAQEASRIRNRHRRTRQRQLHARANSDLALAYCRLTITHSIISLRFLLHDGVLHLGTPRRRVEVRVESIKIHAGACVGGGVTPT